MKGMSPSLTGEECGLCGQDCPNLGSVLRNWATLSRFLQQVSTNRIFIVLLCFNVFVNAVFMAPKTMAGTYYKLKTA